MPPALYNAYITGSAGSNIVLFYVDDEIIAGIDAGTGKYRGVARRLPNGGLRVILQLTVAPGQPLLTGGVAEADMRPVPIEFELPAGFDDGAMTVLIRTPIGPVNARFEKLMDI